MLGLNDKVIAKDENGNEKSGVCYKGRAVGNCLDNSLSETSEPQWIVMLVSLVC